MQYIYKLTSPSNKVYIGQHTWQGEGLDPDYFCSSGNPHFWNAVALYGQKNFKQEIVEIVDGDQQLLDDRETYWIQQYFGENCYNLMDKANSWNHCHTPEIVTKQIQTHIENGSQKKFQQAGTEAARQPEVKAKAQKTREENGAMQRFIDAAATPSARVKAVNTRRENGGYVDESYLKFQQAGTAAVVATKAYQKALDIMHANLLIKYEWFYNGDLVYVGNVNSATKKSNSLGQTWDQSKDSIPEELLTNKEWFEAHKLVYHPSRKTLMTDGKEIATCCAISKRVDKGKTTWKEWTLTEFTS